MIPDENSPGSQEEAHQEGEESPKAEDLSRHHRSARSAAKWRGSGKKLTLWRHKRTGRIYLKISPAFYKGDDASATGLNRMVVYQDLDGFVYVRRESEFLDRFDPIKEEDLA